MRMVKSIKSMKIKCIFNDGNVVKGEAVILATGTKERLLNIPGEDENLGHGVSFCAVCDGAFLEIKRL